MIYNIINYSGLELVLQLICTIIIYKLIINTLITLFGIPYTRVQLIRMEADIAQKRNMEKFRRYEQEVAEADFRLKVLKYNDPAQRKEDARIVEIDRKYRERREEYAREKLKKREEQILKEQEEIKNKEIKEQEEIRNKEIKEQEEIENNKQKKQEEKEKND